MITKEDSKKIEEAVSFLVGNYNGTGFNEKPVILHSLKVGMELLRMNESVEIVIIGILHDLLEDSRVTYDKIKEKFGEDIARGVLSVSENKEIEDYVDKYKEMFTRVEQGGRPSIIVKAVDIYDNSFFISLEKDLEKKRFLFNKIEDFLVILKKHNLKFYDILESRYKEEQKKAKNHL
jgi:(p)ppGpp synthase/HD superfamily hydrolase